ncbi:MAG TPA: metalloregulator ArsR/SmtB family transcription factor [Methylophilaceae bacterium]|nr:metalloregulator ArsR/SmtB family transcription factor [Methylophilaceae bacterium]HZV63277.1 metalloregulator ArsR/SmtB family transcription factor [Methylophilaceae bacterium]
MESKLAVTLLSSIAQEARLEIFRLLVQAGSQGLAAGAIAERLSIPTSTLSFHLKELTHAGMAIQNPQGRFIYYTANYQAMNELMTYLTLNCCAGEQHCCAPECPPDPHKKESTS